ncbi:hypothetical protein WICPIJ_001694, partial [Wickerhamomyces pijperi]
MVSFLKSSVLLASAVSAQLYSNSSSVASSSSSSEQFIYLPSSTESSASASATPVDISFKGGLDNGSPSFKLTLPGNWNSMYSFELVGEAASNFVYSGASITLNGQSQSGSISVNSTNFDVQYDVPQDLTVYDAVVVDINAVAAGAAPYSQSVVLAVTLPDDAHLAKRDHVEYLTLAAVITDAASTTTTIGGSSTVSASTSTATATAQESTTITITSCFDNACIQTPVVTGVTVVTTTIHGVQTIYTTYCPLTATTLTGATGSEVQPPTTSTATVYNPETTVVTITSCSHDACSTFPVTTGVTVITSTSAGETTTYTSYIPLTITEATGSEIQPPTTSTATAYKPETTVVTITSCSHNACSTFPVTTGVTVITSTSAGETTTYTSYI